MTGGLGERWIDGTICRRKDKTRRVKERNERNE